MVSHATGTLRGTPAAFNGRQSVAAAAGVLHRHYREDASGGGHAACLVGYTPTHFIVRNSWGQRWGDGGFAYASDAYAASAFDEAYGAVL